MYRSARRERGLALGTLVIVLAILVSIVAFGFKVTPAWVEYFGIKKAVKAMETGGDLKKTPNEIRAAFDRHAEVGYISSITGKDLEMTKTEGGYTVAFAYRKEVPVVANMSVVFDFNGGTARPSGRRGRAID